MVLLIAVIIHYVLGVWYLNSLKLALLLNEGYTSQYNTLI